MSTVLVASASASASDRRSAIDGLRRRMSRRRVAVPEITEDHLGAAQPLRIRYSGRDLDRRDFRAVRPLGRYKAFRELPTGLPL